MLKGRSAIMAGWSSRDVKRPKSSVRVVAILATTRSLSGLVGSASGGNFRGPGLSVPVSTLACAHHDVCGACGLSDEHGLPSILTLPSFRYRINVGIFSVMCSLKPMSVDQAML